MAKKTGWTYDRFRKSIDTRFKNNRTYAQCELSFRQLLIGEAGQVMLIRAALIQSFYYALAPTSVFNACSSPQTARNALHLIWRLEAISVATMLEQIEKLFAERARPRIAPLSTQRINDILMLVAAGNVLGSVDGAAYFWKKACFLADADSLRIERDAFSAGPVEPFLFNLCTKFYGNRTPLPIPKMSSAREFVDIEQNWETVNFDSAADELLALKRTKLLAKGLNNDLVFGLNSGINFFVPFEYLFMRQVRQKTGLPMKETDDELVNLPVCKELSVFSETGFNSHIQELLNVIRELLPNFSLPWEERLQALPPTEFQSVIAD